MPDPGSDLFPQLARIRDDGKSLPGGFVELGFVGGGKNGVAGKFLLRPLEVDVVEELPEQIISVPVDGGASPELVAQIANETDSKVGLGFGHPQVDFQFLDTAFHGCSFASAVGLDSRLDPASNAKERLVRRAA